MRTRPVASMVSGLGNGEVKADRGDVAVAD
jgi:hypothetical protein